MQKESLIVKYITVNNCFVKLPNYWLRKLGDQAPILQISHHKKNYFVTYASKPSPDDTLRISATFARSLDIREDDQVLVSSAKASSLTYVEVIPQTDHDLEILALQRDKVQSTLLQQVSVVAKNQAIVAWISKFSYVTLITESLTPNSTHGILTEFTELHVSNVVAREKKSIAAPVVPTSGDKKLTPERCSKKLQKDRENDDILSSELYALLKSFRNRATPYIFRVCCLPVLKCPFGRNSKYDEIMCGPFHAFVSQKHLPQGVDLTGTNFFHCKITKIPQDRQHVDSKSTNFLRNETSDDLEPPSELTLDLYLMEEIRDKCSTSIQDAFHHKFVGSVKDSIGYKVDWISTGIHNTIYLSDTAMTNLKLKVGSKVMLKITEDLKFEHTPSVKLYPHSSTTKEDFIRYVKKLSKYNMLLLNSSCTIIEDSVPQFTIKLMPERCTWARFNSQELEKLEITEHSNVDYKHIDDIPKLTKSNRLVTDIKAQGNIRGSCEQILIVTLGLYSGDYRQVARENMLICGPIGSGKTTLCNVLMEDLQTGPYFLHTHIIDCKPLKGKKVEVLQKILTSAIVECAYHQPSLLILENLECITNVSNTDEENTPDSVNAARTTDMIINVVTQHQETRFISVIGTCTSADKLGRRLRPAKGSDFFRCVFTITNPDQEDRYKVLFMALGRLLSPTISDDVLTIYAKKTVGWTPRDLLTMARKAEFAARKRFARTEKHELAVVTKEDIEKAFREYTPISLRDLSLHKDSKYTWTDIGGLNNVKRCLIEMIQWPLMYPEIFRKSPIKLQNGVLIYGMPGTGKTMLAKAIANECKVNLISVKGPELLSKYIGVSEESVRNVFEKALRAKPCVLFFDEFDSLAPRRGHDSTGVTDRVVNQLLTQLDGVEDREGVVVVAASSRPDLLDPALLRPGRLDKSLHCPLPDEEDRWDILKALCRTLKVNVQESDLKQIAQLSPGFTGADLNAVLTQARLSALEDAISADPSGKLHAEDIIVTHDHLVVSVKNTRPSLSENEKEKYRRIYTKFSNGGNFTEDILRNQKATLA